MKNLKKVILFAGTTEGRIIAEALYTHENVRVHVATDYGKSLLPQEKDGFRVYSGRLDSKQMLSIMTEGGFLAKDEDKPVVIDATHPFAIDATRNIKNAAEIAGAEYLRVLREENWQEESEEYDDNLIYAEDIKKAAEIVNRLGEKTLVTTGSKELLPFTEVKNYKELVTVRILPLQGALRSAIAMGFEGKNLICMQGPFSVEMNRALIRKTEAGVMVTKESGDKGGFSEKIEACRQEHIKVIVVKRPEEKTGYYLSELFEILKEKGINISTQPETGVESGSFKNLNNRTGISSDRGKDLKRWFPAFIDMRNKKILIVGGGKVAERRAETLVKFQGRVTVVAPEVSKKIMKLAEKGRIKVKKEPYEKDHIGNSDIVIAATDDESLNAEICQQAKEKDLLANDAGCKENCNFFFPAVSLKDSVTVGITAQGKNHRLAGQVRKEVDSLLNKTLKNR